MSLLDQLLDRACTTLASHLRSGLVIFGSAPIVLAGLKPDVRDLDFFVSDETFAALVGAGFVANVQDPSVPKIALAEDVDVFKTFPGVEFPDVFASAAPGKGSRGFHVASLRHVLAFKVTRNKPKDQEDIALIRKVLGLDHLDR
ncbi:MAG: hypothetical protein Q8L48_25265 [Archangium sp.]|nr:hypothetical protein [Archangium sp.]